MNSVRQIPLLLLFVLLPAMAFAEARLPASLQTDGKGRVVEVVDGDTVTLDDGRAVRLVGMQAPKLPLDRPNFVKWPYADESKAALEGLVLGRTVALAYGGTRRDRHGRQLAHLVRDDGLWVQGEMLRLGMARVYTFPDNRAAVAEMLAREDEARRARRGMWGLDHYAVLTPDTAQDKIGDYAVVEGRVAAVGEARDTVYLNFGADWKRDFTIALDRPVAAEMKRSGRLPAAGDRVQARGWLKSRNGPMLEVSHPEQLRLLPQN